MLSTEPHIKYGYVLYLTEDYERNKDGFSLYEKAGIRHGYHINIINMDWFRIDMSDNEIKLFYKESLIRLPDFIINRTRDYRIAKFFEGKKIKVFNCSEITRVFNDKALAYETMSKHNIPVLPFSYPYTTEAIKKYPRIIKRTHSHGGKEVYRSDQLPLNIFFNNPDYNYLVQDMALDLGRDIRVYIVDNRIVATVLRSCDTDFRSNYSLGGSISLYDLSQKQLNLINKILSLYHFDMVGIDFIFSNNDIYFNEIEDVVGARMLYKLSSIDIIDMYISSLKIN